MSATTLLQCFVTVGWVIRLPCRLNTYGRRAFSIAGPTVWNSMPDELRDPACGSGTFLRQSCLVFTNVTSALEVFKCYALINPRFTYILTYLLTKSIGLSSLK